MGGGEIHQCDGILSPYFAAARCCDYQYWIAAARDANHATASLYLESAGCSFAIAGGIREYRASVWRWVLTQQVIPVQPVPSQTFQATLGTQNCSITLQWMSTGLFASLSINGVPIISGKQCVDRVNLIRAAYLGFKGWIYFVDSTGKGCNPNYNGLGSRYLLVYESSP